MDKTIFPTVQPRFKAFTRMLLALFFCGTCSSALAEIAIPVQVSEVQLQDLAPITPAIGYIYSKDTVKLSAKVEGELIEVARPGSKVKTGEILAKLDAVPIQLKMKQMQAKIDHAKIKSNYLLREYNRIQMLSEKEAASENALEKVKSDYELAKAHVTLLMREMDILAYDLSRTEILAPFDGIVSARFRNFGASVLAEETIVAMMDTENLEARVVVPLKFKKSLDTGNWIQIKNAENERTVCKITALIPSDSQKKQSFELRLEIPKEHNHLWSIGESVTVLLTGKSSIVTTVVHRDAIVMRSSGTFVMRVKADKTVESVPVAIGVGQQDYVSVEGDLAPGDTLVTWGADRLIDGQKVSMGS